VLTEQTTLISLGLIEGRSPWGRFYFHLRTGDKLIPDDEGAYLPHFSAALSRLSSPPANFWPMPLGAVSNLVPDAFVIADAAGQNLETVPLAAVLPDPLKK
jgi:hypothetical protein